MESLVIDFAEGFVTVEVNINLPDEVVVGTVSCQRVLAVVNETIWSTFIDTIAAEGVAPENGSFQFAIQAVEPTHVVR